MLEPSAPTDHLVSGSVAFVGAGPGDPDLLTRRGARFLAEADVVLADGLLDEDGFRALAPQALWLDVAKRAGRPSTEQDFIGRMLVSQARRGQRVVRLKGGDPAVFGRLTEELEMLDAAGIPWQMVPGVTAASASAAELGVSLTQRGVARSLVILTPAEGRGEVPNRDWLCGAAPGQTLAIYMAGSRAQATARALIARGWAASTPVAAVESASLRTSSTHGTSTVAGSDRGLRHVLTLESMAELGLPPLILGGPVCILVGDALAGLMGLTGLGHESDAAPSTKPSSEDPAAPWAAASQ